MLFRSIQNDISDDNYNEIVENLETLEDCLDGDCIESMKGCNDWECAYEYDGYWQEFVMVSDMVIIQKLP